ncbi:MAG TPA: hypothetical protein VE621_06515 [Bryobacteraceae bacterium]|nr:hypothetical protein [Bryobacteraceae bacterium]
MSQFSAPHILGGVRRFFEAGAMMRTSLLFVLPAAVVIAANPAALEARKAEVQALLEEHNYASALELAKSINRERMDDIASYQLIAAAHLGLGNYAEAESAIQWMLDLRIGKAEPGGWMLVARFREITGDLEGAADAVNLAARDWKGDPNELLAYAAHLQFLMGKLERAGQLATGNMKATYTLARVLLAQGRKSEAARLLRGVGETSPESLFLLASATGEAKDFQAFEAAARACSERSRNTNRELVLYLAGRGKRVKEALTIAQREAERSHDVFTQDALAVAMYANGLRIEARDLMKRVIAVGVRDPDILAHAAMMKLPQRPPQVASASSKAITR